MSVSGKIALVTAGASGIGYAIAKLLSSKGAQVWICDIDERRVAQLSDGENPIRAIVGDVGDEDDVNRLFDHVLGQTQGQLDILVNNAGIAGPNGPLETLHPDDFNETLRINLLSAFLCTRKALPVMKKCRSGSIVNLSSTAGLYGFPLRTPYAAAKWGIIGLTKSLAMEAGAFGIRVNAICPGSVSGPRMDRVIADEASTRKIDEDDVRSQFVKQTSLRCFVEADDIAQMVMFICSDEGAKISGQALAVDGNTESLSQID